MTSNAAAPAARPVVLVVDDSPGDLALIELALTQAGEPFALVHATALREAEAVLEARKVDAILLDLHLPDGSGVACVESLASRFSDRPIVVLTGQDDDALALACIGAGAHDYVSKRDLEARNLPRALRYAIARGRERTERRRAEALQDRLAAIVAASSDAILSTDSDGVITSWNDGATAIFGHTPEEAVGQHLGVLVRELDGFSARDSKPSEISIPRRGGDRICEMRVVPFEWHGDPAYVVTIRDITDLKAGQRQLLMNDRLVSLGTMAAGVAHEINSPLAAIMANVGAALREVQSLATASTTHAELIDELSDARDAAERIRVIVRDLKSFSRADEELRGPFDVHRVIESAARMAGFELRSHVQLVKRYGVVPPVYVNEARLCQVFLNLLINASQAMSGGEPSRSEIRITTCLDDAGRVRVEIEDTGPGIALEVQQRMFTPFFTTKPAGAGTGLGLAICQRIVRSFGGEITFESHPGTGTCFHVVLPAAAADAVTKTPATGTRRPIGVKPRPKVLVIDDDPLIRRLLERSLGREYAITTSDGSFDALQRLRAGERFDVILCDLLMPDMTGMDLWALLDARDPDHAARMVFVTGGASTIRAEEFLESRPSVTKPFDIHELRAAVDRVLARHA